MPRRNHVPTVFDKAAELIVEKYAAEGKLAAPQDVLGEMCKAIMNKMMETERDQHLGYSRYDREEKATTDTIVRRRLPPTAATDTAGRP